MKKCGYELEFSAVVKIVLTDPSLSPSDGFFYIKSFTFNEGEPTVISTFSQDKDTAKLDRSTVLADFWEEGVQVSWYKEDEESDQWVIEVGGSLIVEPINSPEDWCIEECDISSLQLELRRDGDSPPESFDSFEFVSGQVFSVTNLVRNDEDEWEEATDDDADDDG